ncbi:RNA demethylase ALKBH10B-like [Nymphaea colorata]|uniref:RNA demethylase ALKBH10B-like n=1 Tax=Nymphaea colorata TaxID=210225 RepID=UPI00129D8A73|nr:RNA demethylase ALKBH10B-like [Nymphaea colorata]XP_031498295.1 RNA demethylase ALKBH10B-like [Nymphaea colorata]XP_031498296.1 RNA demethylase ALKBH10B-like [Nymphaea colorata]XP_049936182.1 RNA demethylase ALKBH10B-like [Nymphaea colorata]
MPTGDATVKSPVRVACPEKMQSPGGNDTYQEQWLPDGKDAFILWLRAEFAAANAIIDSLCYHLRCIGEPGEYEVAFECIQQRRFPWTPVLYMQPYFSVADIMQALQQVASGKQTRNADPPTTPGSFPYPKLDREKRTLQIAGGRRGNKSTGAGHVKDNHSVAVDSQSLDHESSALSAGVKEGLETSGGKGGQIGGAFSGPSFISSESNEGTDTEREPSSREVALEVSGINSGDEKEGHQKDGVNANREQNEKQNSVPAPKTFVALEILDEEEVNVAEGLELYEELFHGSEVLQLLSFANKLRSSGQRGELQGQTFLPSKRPMKGRGRETLQLGIPIIDKPLEDDNEPATSRDCKTEPIPDVLQDIVDRLFQLQLISVKPDACIVDFFDEGDHSHPHTCPPWFGRPLSSLFLTKCSMVFGRVISIEHPGDYRGSLELSLQAGALLVMKGKSADFAKRAIPSIRSQRVIVTFTKVQSKNMLFADGPHLSSAAARPRGAASPRLLSMVRHPGPKNYGRVPSTGVLHVPSVSPQHLPTNDMQPIFLGAPAARSVPYAPPRMTVPEASTTGLPSAAVEAAQPRIPASGTGVFLPPAGTGQPPLQQLEGEV